MHARHALTIFATGDLEAALRFYSAAFGWKQLIDTPVYAELALPRGMRLGLYEREAFAATAKQAPLEPSEGAITATELYFYVDDVDAMMEQLSAAGAQVLSSLAARDWGDEAAYFADLDGNVIVIARRLESGPEQVLPLEREEGEAIARRWISIFQGGDTAVLDELHSESFIDHAAAGRDITTAGFKQGVAAIYGAFPDYNATIDDVLIDVDERKIAIRWHATGTHRGTFIGSEATDKEIAFNGIDVLELGPQNEVIARHGEWDGVALVRQLALIL
jgi:steroid delta-isomerase-like uncharacterized protein